MLRYSRYLGGWCRGNDLDLYSGGARFESRLARRLSWQKFYVIFLTPFRQMSGYISIRHYLFLLNPFQFITHPPVQSDRVWFLKACLYKHSKRNHHGVRLVYPQILSPFFMPETVRFVHGIYGGGDNVESHNCARERGDNRHYDGNVMLILPSESPLFQMQISYLTWNTQGSDCKP
jgi:hypothetical protein